MRTPHTHGHPCVLHPRSALKNGKFNCCRTTNLTNCLLFVCRLTLLSHQTSTNSNYLKANKWIDFPPNPTPWRHPTQLLPQVHLRFGGSLHWRNKQAWKQRFNVKPCSLLLLLRAPWTLSSAGSLSAPCIPVITHGGGGISPPVRSNSHANMSGSPKHCFP